MANHSTIKRPPTKWVQIFKPDMSGEDTVREYLAKGFSLGICCKRCPRLLEWTPLELQEKFGDKPDLRIQDVAARLRCTGPEGCGSDEVAVFPHLYDEPWYWSGGRG